MSKDLLSVVSNINSLVQNASIVAVVVAAVAGVTLAGYAAVKLHRELANDGMWGQRPNYFGYVIGIILGCGITISSVIVGWFGLLYG